MRLVRFKVTNFRSVVDSGWIEAERVTALVGVNESGKTNLLLPLWKLNPARDGEIKPTPDYPKSKYAAIKADPSAFDFICAEFDCSALVGRLIDKTGRDGADLSSVQVSRDFNGKYSVTFPRCHVAREADAAVVCKLINDAKIEVNDMTSLAKEASLKAKLLASLEAASKASGSDGALSTGGDVGLGHAAGTGRAGDSGADKFDRATIQAPAKKPARDNLSHRGGSTRGTSRCNRSSYQ